MIKSACCGWGLLNMFCTFYNSQRNDLVCHFEPGPINLMYVERTIVQLFLNVKIVSSGSKGRVAQVRKVRLSMKGAKWFSQCQL